MTPKRPPGEHVAQTEGADPSESGRRLRTQRPDDVAFMEQIVHEFADQNERARAASAARAEAAARHASNKKRVTEEPISSGPPSSAPVQSATILINDPRRLPTMRIPRRERGSEPRERAGRAPRPKADEPANTLRSGLVNTTVEVPQNRRTWIGAALVTALVALVVIAIALQVSRKTGSNSPPDVSGTALR
ncbi:MAG: hypothetical protein IPK82_18470 [Polyangiaceae bacterium]|nr:hypothetical protein [Polyangiaceae bacterium]